MLLAALLASGASAQAEPCAMEAADREWLAEALDTWQRVEREYLRLEPRPLPTVFAVDGACTHRLPEGAVAAASGLPHEGQPRFPDGGEAPLGPISFASGEGGYFAMSLPSVWREAGVGSPLGLETLMTGVLLHEMMHIRQTDLATEALGGAAERAGVSDEELTDDIVQHRFESDPDYVAAYTAERDALFAAAAAESDHEARRLAAQALRLMRERRARWFTGDKAAFTDLDDVFLTMEGMGQWLIYRYFVSAEGPAQPPEVALPAVRRGGRWWSQDEGLALMLVVDRLLPGWQARAFRDPDWRAAALLAAAVGEDGQRGE